MPRNDGDEETEGVPDLEIADVTRFRKGGIAGQPFVEFDVVVRGSPEVFTVRPYQLDTARGDEDARLYSEGSRTVKGVGFGVGEFAKKFGWRPGDECRVDLITYDRNYQEEVVADRAYITDEVADLLHAGKPEFPEGFPSEVKPVVEEIWARLDEVEKAVFSEE